MGLWEVGWKTEALEQVRWTSWVGLQGVGGFATASFAVSVEPWEMTWRMTAGLLARSAGQVVPTASFKACR